MEEKKMNVEQQKDGGNVKKAAETKKDDVKKEVKKKETKKEKVEKAEVKKEGTKKTNPENKKDDLTFKKVEMTQDGKKTLNEMDKKEKKSHGFIKAILILLMIVIAAYCIFFVRNLIILNSISDKMSELNECTNFSYASVSKAKDNSSETTIEYYKKDNLERLDIHKDGATITTWYDSDSDKKVISIPVNREAEVSTVADWEFLHLPVETNLNYQNSIAYMSLVSYIYSEEYNSKDCYVISFGEGQKTWIDKETGLVLKRETEQNVVEYSDIRMNELTDIYEPDLTGYEVENLIEEQTQE